MATEKTSLEPPRVELLPLADDGTYPNNARLPVLLYKGALRLPGGSDAAASTIEQVFEENGWCDGWRNGIYDFHHYHSTAHEVLGCYGGSARAQLGGPKGPEVHIERGDVLVLPAGVSHKKLQSSTDFRVVGAYAGGRSYDMNQGKSGERPRADANIANVPLPQADPVYGTGGPLHHHWLVHP
jgi:uncharacterized protein YjlB